MRLFRAVGLSSQRTGHRGQGCRHRWAGSGGHRRLTGSAPKASEQGWGTWSFCVLGTLPWQLVRRQQSPEGQEPTAPEGHVPPLPCPTLILPSGPGASLLLRPRRRGPVSSPGPAAGGPSCHKSPRRQPGALPLGLGISPHATTCLGVRGRVPDGHHGFPVSNSHPLARESPFNSTICGAARGQIRRRIPGLRSATGLGQRDSNGEVQARGVLSPAAPLGLPGPPLSPLWALRMPKPRCPSAPRPGLDPPACPRASSLGTPPAPPLAPIGCDSPGPAPGSLAPGHWSRLVLCPHRRRPLLHATRARARGCCVLTTPSRVLSLGGCLWGSKHQQKPAWGTGDGAPWAEAAAGLEAVRGNSCTPGPGRGRGDRTCRQNDCFPACDAPVVASHACRFAGPSWRRGHGSTVLI